MHTNHLHLTYQPLVITFHWSTNHSAASSTDVPTFRHHIRLTYQLFTILTRRTNSSSPSLDVPIFRHLVCQTYQPSSIFNNILALAISWQGVPTHTHTHFSPQVQRIRLQLPPQGAPTFPHLTRKSHQHFYISLTRRTNPPASILLAIPSLPHLSRQEHQSPKSSVRKQNSTHLEGM